MTLRNTVLALTALGLAAGAHAAVSTPAAEAPPPAPFTEAALPLYLVRQAQAPMTIDGRLDEFDWAAAPQIDAFHRILNLYTRVLNPTRARMLWDADNLYVAFACRDRDIWALFTEEDDPMWSEEVVEAFIDPDGDGRDYLEVEINPLNAIVDLHIGQVRPQGLDSDKDWDIAGLRTAVEIHGTVNDSSDVDEGWTMEMAIPWSAFTPTIVGGERPQVGARWRLNLYRIERGAGAGVRAQLRDLQARDRELSAALEALGEPGDAAERARLEEELSAVRLEAEPLAERESEETEYTAWSPTFQRGFHHPGRFGIVEFAP